MYASPYNTKRERRVGGWVARRGVCGRVASHKLQTKHLTRAPMTAPHFNFSPASVTETLVFGACRPGYPAKSVARREVDEWVAFMKSQAIKRVVCLLSRSQLRHYDDLLGTHRAAFGQGQVCWAPVEDYSLPDPSLLTETILPFLRQSLSAEEPPVVHCSAGVGRTGFVLAAYLVGFQGFSNHGAIRAVAKGRRDACESGDPGVPDLLNLCRQSFRA